MTDARIPVFFIGCVQSSEVALKALLARPKIAVNGVLTLRASTFNADFVDIAGIAMEAGVPVHYAEETDAQALAAVLRDGGAEIVFTIGCSRLLGAEILGYPAPWRRGLSPGGPAAEPGLPSADLGAGAGARADRIDAVRDGRGRGPRPDPQPVHGGDHAAERCPEPIWQGAGAAAGADRRHRRPSGYGLSGRSPAGSRTGHRPAQARHAGRADRLAHVRRGGAHLTRAPTHPYVGAEFRHCDRLIKLWRCEIVTGAVPRNAEPGKVLNVDARGPVIKTGMGADGGAVRLLDTEDCPELHKGEYL